MREIVYSYEERCKCWLQVYDTLLLEKEFDQTLLSRYNKAWTARQMNEKRKVKGLTVCV